MGLFTSYWGVFGWQNVWMDGWIYIVVLAVVLIAVVSLIGMLPHIRRARWEGSDTGPDPFGLLLLLLAAGTTAWLVSRRYYVGSYFPGLNAGRFLFPAIPAVSLFLAAGLARVRIPGLRISALPVTAGLLLSLSILAPFLYIGPFYHFPSIPVRASLDPQVSALPNAISFANGVSLVGFAVDKRICQPGDTVSVSLLWRAERNLSTEFTAFVHLTDRGGRKQTGDDSVPLQYVFSPALWREGEYVRDDRQLQLPANAPAGLYSIRLGLYFPDSAGGKPRPILVANEKAAAGDDASMGIELGHLKVSGGTALPAETKVLDYSFNRKIALIGYNPALVSPSGTIDTVLYWQASTPTGIDYTVSVQVLGENNRVVSQHDGEPGSGLNPTSSWIPNEVVRDEHRLVLPQNTEGQLRLAVVVYSLADMQRLPIYGSDGTLLGDSVIIAELR